MAIWYSYIALLVYHKITPDILMNGIEWVALNFEDFKNYVETVHVCI